jgi:hypothetical protein
MNLYVMFDNIVAHPSPSQSLKIIDCCICDVFEGFNCKESLVTADIKRLLSTGLELRRSAEGIPDKNIVE